jgi:hypothetical protein
MALQIPDSLSKALKDLGWTSDSYYYDYKAGFRHQDYTIDEKGFWIELKLSSNLNMAPALDCEIIEHGNSGTLFYGYLETGDDLIAIMKLLYIFRDDKTVQRYLDATEIIQELKPTIVN